MEFAYGSTLGSFWKNSFLVTASNLGYGRKIKFWQDGWLGISSYKMNFKICSIWCRILWDMEAQCTTEKWWEEKLRRILKDWQTGSITGLIEKLDKYGYLSDKPDCLCWKPYQKVALTIKSCYPSLVSSGRARMVSHGSTCVRSTPH